MAAATVAALAVGVVASEPAAFTPSQRSHWAWKKPVAAVPPKARNPRNQAWVRNPVDAFILARMEAAGLAPAPSASREQLVRRVAFDLTGLPPTLVEQDAFMADAAPGAYERMVDRYLASPAFGERWARHWLDLARYADSNGYEFDEVRPDMWRYRDYVVRSFNDDKPYNRFVQEQLAGDELDAGTLVKRDADAVIATGFNLLGPDMTDAANQAARRQNTLNDMTDTAGLAFLGLTLGCARCHDHKYEPITQQDYYRFQAFFAAARFRKDLPAGTREEEERYRTEEGRFLARLKQLTDERDTLAGAIRHALREARIARLKEDLRVAFTTPEAQRTIEQRILVERNAVTVEPPPKDVLERLPAAARPRYEKLMAEIKNVEGQRPRRPSAVGIAEDGPEAPPTFILGRGEIENRGIAVEPGFPIILARTPPDVRSTLQSTGRRAALAKWLTNSENPLTARVMANRVWHHLFGRGLIATTSDFGVRGDSPTHPELLDALAVAFASGKTGAAEARPWSVKSLIRLILTSSTYRQSSVPKAGVTAKDPENLLFSRMPRKRLESEAVRDGMLAVSGRLNAQAGGPGVFPPIPEEVRPKGDVWPVTKDAAQWTRRSLYVFNRRNLQHPGLEVFDAPDTNQSCSRRESTTTAPQALALLNGEESQQNAKALARRVIAEARDERESTILLYRLVLSRVPSAEEHRLASEFLTRQSALLKQSGGAPEPDAAAWSDLSLALLNTNEFLYVD